MTVTTGRSRRPGRLPSAMTSFIGRRREVAEARGLLSASRMLTLTGTGGVGKTRLAMQVAESVRRAFRDGVWLVELADLTEPSMLAQTVAGALGLRDESPAPVTRLAEHLADKQALIVLDNCEHLLETASALVASLLRGCPRLIVLATSRARLGLIAECVFDVAPLAVPERGAQTTRGTAIELFCSRVRAAGVELATDDQSMEPLPRSAVASTVCRWPWSSRRRMHGSCIRPTSPDAWEAQPSPSVAGSAMSPTVTGR